ncbi:MAG: hypothetical protein EA381_05150 [Planctomycetaceae bacterium]|nr:MAG: hypothetical protein EA381_05150 [Planctomycetaceae bacterium]
MANLLAIDWDSHELRAVLGRGGSGGITLTDMTIIPLPGEEPAQVSAALTGWLNQINPSRSKTRLLVAIGRGKAELRQLNLPPVPPEELPALVRFQALQSLSISSDSAAVDYLPIESSDQSTSVIAGGVAPATMKHIADISESISIELKRVALRPVAAAALYSAGANGQIADCVLVDLLADDVEIVVFRNAKVVFVRSVRMPQQTAGRTTQIAGEIRRSLMACGTEASETTPTRVIIWGQAKTHESEAQSLRETLRCEVATLDPLSLVTLDWRGNKSGGRNDATAEHTGRFAPLIGLMAADAAAEAIGGQSPLLIDFLNPRKTVEVQRDDRLWIGAGAGALAVALLLAFLAWSSLSSKTAQIEERRAQLAELRPAVTQAETGLARTEQIDQFLDGNVIWLDQLQRLAERMPPSERAILKNMSGGLLAREGGSRLTLQAAAKLPVVVDQMETALRDEDHSVSGTGANDLGDKNEYRWGFTQSVTVRPTTIREARYEAFTAALEESEAEPMEDSPSDDSDSPETAESTSDPVPLSPATSTEPAEGSLPVEPLVPVEPQTAPTASEQPSVESVDNDTPTEQPAPTDETASDDDDNSVSETAPPVESPPVVESTSSVEGPPTVESPPAEESEPSEPNLGSEAR